MEYQKFTFNPFQENTYLLWDETKNAIIIDPGCFYPGEFQELQEFIKLKELKPSFILNTHCHIDHMLGFTECVNAYDLGLHCHPLEMLNIDRLDLQSNAFGLRVPADNWENIRIDKEVQEGDLICFGNTELEVFFVPGHSPGHLAFLNRANKLLIGGDVLFREGVGRTDLPNCSHSDLMQSIKEKLYTLDDDIEVLPGHMDSTTIGHEKQFNPFVKG